MTCAAHHARNQIGILSYTFEYEGHGKDPGSVECQIHFGFNPSTPETGRGYMADPAKYDPGSGFEVWLERAEIEVECDGKKAWQPLIPGEWLEGQCENYLMTREECDLIEGLPERDSDHAREDAYERRMMEREP